MSPEFWNLLQVILHQSLRLQSLTISKVLVVIIVNVELYFSFFVSQVDLYSCYVHKKPQETRRKPKELTLDQQASQKNVLIHNNYECHKNPHIKHTISMISLFIYFKGRRNSI